MQEAFINREDYESGRRIADNIRDHTARVRLSSPVEWDDATTAGIFGVMMKYFSASGVWTETRVSDPLQPDVLEAFIHDRIPYDTLKKFLEKLDDGKRIAGVPRGSLLKYLEDSSILRDKELLNKVHDALDSAKFLPGEKLCDVCLATGIELMLRYGSYVGSGISFAASVPIPVMKILRKLSSGKEGMLWYGATSDSVLLLPYCTAHRARSIYACFEKERLLAAVIMILLMASDGQRIEVQTAALPCIPRDHMEIIGKCDRAFAFTPAYQLMLPEQSMHIDYDKMRQCIAWWPEYQVIDQWIYVRHILQTLNDQGIGYVFMPLGLLSRTGGMEKIRKSILEKNVLDAVIEFPGGVFARTNTPYALLILRKGRKERSVYMLNLAGKRGKKLIRVNMRLQEVRIPDSDEISALIRDRKSVTGLSCLVKPERIVTYGYCFGPRAYVEEEPVFTLKDTQKLTVEKSELEENLAETDIDYRRAMEEYAKLRVQWEEELRDE